MLAPSRLISCERAAHIQRAFSAFRPSLTHPKRPAQLCQRPHRSRKHSGMSFAGFFSGLFGGGNGSNPQVSVYQDSCFRVHTRRVLLGAAQHLKMSTLCQGRNADVLRNARQAKPTCPPGPEAAPAGKQLATFAGMPSIDGPPSMPGLFPSLPCTVCETCAICQICAQRSPLSHHIVRHPSWDSWITKHLQLLQEVWHTSHITFNTGCSVQVAVSGA